MRRSTSSFHGVVSSHDTRTFLFIVHAVVRHSTTNVDVDKTMTIYLQRVFLIITLIITSGCATLPRNAIPIDEIYMAEVPDIPGVRAWADMLSDTFQADLQLSLTQEEDEFLADSKDVYQYNVLALSGGGSNGAFGAGVLNGWSQNGNRPRFKLITGISTGALIAPFAFLGLDYDGWLRDFYTRISTPDILEELGILKFLRSPESFANTDPLKQLLKEVITEELLRAIAEKHNRGYRLYIGSTHLDAQRLMIWNMGMIANSGSADALDLFRDIMLASSSIPAAFPPVLIEVEANGKLYDEMHVDGGASAQVFYYRNTINGMVLAHPAPTDRAPQISLYIIRNGKIPGDLAQIPRKLSDISHRAISTMTKAIAKGDLYRLYAVTQRDNVNFNYISIPDDYQGNANEAFDMQEMQRIFDLGYELGLSGNAWKKTPPGLFKENDK